MTLLHIPLSGEKSSLCPTLLACLLAKSSKKGQKTWEEWWEDLLLKRGGEGGKDGEDSYQHIVVMSVFSPPDQEKGHC